MSIDDKISSDNITEVSLKASFNDPSSKPDQPPTLDELKTSVIQRFDNAINNQYTSPEHKMNLEFKKNRLIAIFNDEMPDGFDLVPVMSHDMKDYDSFQEVKDEYGRKVHHQFVRFLADNYEDDLKKRGVSEYLIRLMRNGMIFRDSFYASIDHVVERFYSGNMVTNKSKDPLNTYTTEATAEVNHFKNLVLIPQKVHDLKNEIRELQLAVTTVYDPTYLIMLVPKKLNKDANPFMATKQSNMKKYGIYMPNDDEVISSLINYMNTKPESEIIAKVKRQEALSCINDHLRDKFTAAVKDKSPDGGNIQKLAKFYRRNKLEDLQVKLKKLKGPIVEEFAATMSETQKFLVKHGLLDKNKISSTYNRTAVKKKTEPVKPEEPRKEHNNHHKKHKKKYPMLKGNRH